MSHIIAESNDDFSHGHFELKNFILAQKLEKKATNEGRPLISSIFELQSSSIAQNDREKNRH